MAINIIEKQTTEETFGPLKGKVAVVTGGSRGIGSAIAKLLAKNGAQVAFTYQFDDTSAGNVVTEIENDGGLTYASQVNVSEIKEVNSCLEEVIKRYGKIDILVNNAGITRDRSFRNMSQEEWNEVINVNLNSVFNTTSAVINQMITQKFGRIINIGSIIGQSGGFGQTNYAASKAGLVGFTKSLALETAKNGITVNAICPGFIETEMVAEMPDAIRDSIISKVPMKRLGHVDEIAEAVLFLAQSNYITGQEINVNGGLYM
ncbi:3-oxoacyl-[acyl-carrier-protein] reductase [Sporosarcina sp. P13]|uniref:3-oxoacyl-[acyl-carrier-protein] reductase n=1 Tax=Sporosarcina sp. P13 TaxID=2048263 RepID=UPI000C166607|nr:3-oxoacyl-[acyl-carrier-protein] reductase [Sporosarcina sp. P13]PIC63035.1 3-oxoacyl-[acyl-carrier-protein] reductase [Sporosarcina sp. P13]